MCEVTSKTRMDFFMKELQFSEGCLYNENLVNFNQGISILLVLLSCFLDPLKIRYKWVFLVKHSIFFQVRYSGEWNERSLAVGSLTKSWQCVNCRILFVLVVRKRDSLLCQVQKGMLKAMFRVLKTLSFCQNIYQSGGNSAISTVLSASSETTLYSSCQCSCLLYSGSWFTPIS